MFLGIPECAIGWGAHLVNQMLLKPAGAAAYGALGLVLVQYAIISTLQAVITGWIALVLIEGQIGGVRVDPVLLAGQAAKRARSLLIVGLILFGGLFGGLILLVVPGLMMATAWCVSVPALIAEDLSPGAAVARSLRLTRGRRWPLFGLLLLVLLSASAVNLVVSRLIRLAAGQIDTVVPIQYFVLPAMSALEHVVVAAFIASIYVELVTLKEGSLKAGDFVL